MRDIKWQVFFCFISVGDLCAAKYVDDQWYRAKVEKLSGNDANILYVDYGNRATISKSKCASLPGAFTGLPPYAKEYTLALCSLAQDVSRLVIRFQSLRILLRSLPWFFRYSTFTSASLKFGLSHAFHLFLIISLTLDANI